MNKGINANNGTGRSESRENSRRSRAHLLYPKANPVPIPGNTPDQQAAKDHLEGDPRGPREHVGYHEKDLNEFPRSGQDDGMNQIEGRQPDPQSQESKWNNRGLPDSS